MGKQTQTPVDGLETKLKETFQAAMPGSAMELDRTPRGARVGGYLIWEHFVGMSQFDRQGQVWDILKKTLNPLERQRLTAILTVTPRELAVMRDDAEFD